MIGMSLVVHDGYLFALAALSAFEGAHHRNRGLAWIGHNLVTATGPRIARLKSKVGEITMDNELLYAKIEALEGKRPLARRRPRR
jgi:hypothetical protein